MGRFRLDGVSGKSLARSPGCISAFLAWRAIVLLGVALGLAWAESRAYYRMPAPSLVGRYRALDERLVDADRRCSDPGLCHASGTIPTLLAWVCWPCSFLAARDGPASGCPCAAFLPVGPAAAGQSLFHGRDPDPADGAWVGAEQWCTGEALRADQHHGPATVRSRWHFTALDWGVLALRYRGSCRCCGPDHRHEAAREYALWCWKQPLSTLSAGHGPQATRCLARGRCLGAGWGSHRSGWPGPVGFWAEPDHGRGCLARARVLWLAQQPGSLLGPRVPIAVAVAAFFPPPQVAGGKWVQRRWVTLWRPCSWLRPSCLPTRGGRGWWACQPRCYSLQRCAGAALLRWLWPIGPGGHWCVLCWGHRAFDLVAGCVDGYDLFPASVVAVQRGHDSGPPSAGRGAG